MHLRGLPLLPRRRIEYSCNRLHTPKVKPRADKDHKEIENAISPKHPIVQPLVSVKDVEPSRIFVTRGVLTELTETVAAILHIAASLGDEGGRVGLACLTWWRCESSELRGRADDRAAVGGSRKEAFKEIVEWRKCVHPDFPELGGLCQLFVI